MRIVTESPVKSCTTGQAAAKPVTKTSTVLTFLPERKRKASWRGILTTHTTLMRTMMARRARMFDYGDDGGHSPAIEQYGEDDVIVTTIPKGKLAAAGGLPFAALLALGMICGGSATNLYGPLSTNVPLTFLAAAERGRLRKKTSSRGSAISDRQR